MAGRRIATVMSGSATAGQLSVSWDGNGGHGRPAPAGVYFLRLRSADETKTVRVVKLGAR